MNKLLLLLCLVLYSGSQFLLANDFNSSSSSSFEDEDSFTLDERMSDADVYKCHRCGEYTRVFYKASWDRCSCGMILGLCSHPLNDYNCYYCSKHPNLRYKNFNINKELLETGELSWKLTKYRQGKYIGYLKYTWSAWMSCTTCARQKKVDFRVSGDNYNRHLQERRLIGQTIEWVGNPRNACSH